jgi:hypothetical protein
MTSTESPEVQEYIRCMKEYETNTTYEFFNYFTNLKSEHTFNYLKKAVLTDRSAIILTNLANHCWKIDKDYRHAFLLYEEAANNFSYPQALNMIGLCYELGYGVLVCKSTAFLLYKQAADVGWTRGQYFLAECYKKGIGCKKNIREEIRLYQKLADKNYTPAINILNTYEEYQIIASEIKARELLELQVKQFRLLDKLDIGSLVYYDIKKYM